jgi:hypothetical protein
MSEKTGPQIRYVDRPDVSETFADSIRGLSFDGQTMRIEFCSVRIDPFNPTEAPTGRQYPVCRMVLTPNAGIELFNRLQQIVKALEKSGAVHRTPPSTATPTTIQ